VEGISDLRNSSSKKNEKKKLGIFVDARDSPWTVLNDRRRGFPFHEVIRGMGFVFLGQHESGVGPFVGHHKNNQSFDSFLNSK
jgi:hypothetical protein